MNTVIPIKKRIDQLDNCSGCYKEIELNENYHQVVMRFDDYVKHIALCVNCFKAAMNEGIHFNHVKKTR